MAIKIEEHVSLAPLTTLNIGGQARYFIRAETEDDIAEGVDFAMGRGLPLFILGGGSNLLVADDGFDGLVLRIDMRGVMGLPASVGVRSVQESRAALVTAGAGEDWDSFVERCVKANFAGVECLSGIPGLVGGVPVQNVGAYGQEVSETINSVRCFDRETRVFMTLSNKDCGFSYRTSIFNSSHRDRYIVTSVTFTLVEGGNAKVVYPELKRAIESSIIARAGDGSSAAHPYLSEVRDTVLSIRRAKSMVIDPHDPNSRSAGSFFKNPIVDRHTFGELKAIHPNIPSFIFGEQVKIPAAWLIDDAGFHKGFSLGRAGISTNHSLAIINRDGASSGEIITLKDQIQAAVKKRFCLDLVTEPVFLGF